MARAARAAREATPLCGAARVWGGSGARLRSELLLLLHHALRLRLVRHAREQRAVLDIAHLPPARPAHPSDPLSGQQDAGSA
eukprot:4094929-Prymnesium_polylepis.2